MNEPTLPAVLRSLPAGSRLTVERAEDGAVKRVAFVASTAVADRADDIVDQGTWKLDNYRSNPVVQVDHEYTASATVARGEVTVVDGVGLVLEIVKWSSKQRAQEARADVEEGIINTVSVGFRPGRMIARKNLDPSHAFYKAEGWGYVYYDCELLEVSIVAVPMNPEALAIRAMERMSAQDIADALITELSDDPERCTLLAELLTPKAEPASSELASLFNEAPAKAGSVSLSSLL